MTADLKKKSCGAQQTIQSKCEIIGCLHCGRRATLLEIGTHSRPQDLPYVFRTQGRQLVDTGQVEATALQTLSDVRQDREVLTKERRTSRIKRLLHKRDTLLKSGAGIGNCSQSDLRAFVKEGGGLSAHHVYEIGKSLQCFVGHHWRPIMCCTLPL